jgi:hypothetical protein
MALVMAWAVFWINTAFFPCCEALAAAFDDQSDGISHNRSASAVTLFTRSARYT